jgi:hypothetical protein
MLGGGFHQTLGNKFDAALRTDHDRDGFDGRQDGQRAADEIRVARRIDQINQVPSLFEVADGWIERMTVRLFLLREIGDGRAAGDRTCRFDRTRLRQKLLDQ